MSHTKVICRTHLGSEVPWRIQKPHLEQRLLARITKLENGCWRWDRHMTSNGYGELIAGGRRYLAHRLAYALWCHEFDPKLYVCHHCDFKLCCNPGHLFLGTSKENTHDMLRKRRHNNNRKTHCKRGHELTGVNLYLKAGKNGPIRDCKVCCRARMRMRAGWSEAEAFSLPVTPHGYRPIGGHFRKRNSGYQTEGRK